MSCNFYLRKTSYSFLCVLGLLTLCSFTSLLGRIAYGQEADVSSVATETSAEEDAGEEKEAAKVTRAMVRELLRSLEGDTLEQRDAAEKELIDLGPAIVPFLPQVDARTSGEMKIRLQRIRESFQNVELESFFEASLVTLNGSMSLQEAVEEISAQTNNEIQLQGEDALQGIDVTADFKELPFWEAVDSIVSQANLRINTFGTTDSALVLGPGGAAADDRPPAYATGPFRVEPTFLQATRQFNAELEGQLQVSLFFSWEPRMKPVYLQIPMQKIEGETAGGEAVSAVNPGAAPEIPLNFGGCTTQIDLQVGLPDRKETALKKLAGEFVIAVPGESHAYEFKNFANGARQTQKFGDVSVILEGARRNGKVYEMRVRIEFGDAQGALDSFRGFILSNQAYMRDKQDKRYENIGLNTYGVGNNAVGIAYLFQVNGDPNDFRFIYESPSSVTKQTVSFELTDIPLP